MQRIIIDKEKKTIEMHTDGYNHGPDKIVQYYQSQGYQTLNHYYPPNNSFTITNNTPMKEFNIGDMYYKILDASSDALRVDCDLMNLQTKVLELEMKINELCTQ